ncbi:hypothetical protein DLJ59_26520 [Micromonospora inaquosa]|uniref:Uncharacterized protein n=2 Tax=Micromonospora inaquosa TaxID=2203716 RepID=A0A3N9WD11_9ACTN|nr:hypothetical protein DLJ59_26520 [Micromonospora inaquosa]
MAMAGMFAGAVPASAGPAQPSEGEIRAALESVADGSWTESDIAVLKQVPEIGHSVPDPRDPGILVTSPQQPGSSAKQSGSRSFGVLALSCTSQWAYVEKNDVFGSRIYRFNVETEWCYDTVTKKLSSIDRADGYLSHTSWGIYFNTWEVDSKSVRGDRFSGYHNKKAAVDYCVAVYGCYTQTHPKINIELGSTAGANPWSWKVSSSSAG